MKRQHYRFPLCIVLLISVLLGCSDDADKQGSVSPADANAITNALVVPGSTRAKGSLPAFSAHPDAPVLDSIDTELITVPGGKLVIAGNLLSGEAEGFYLKVDGADDFFTITPIDPAINGRVGGRSGMSATERNKVTSPYFIIHIPANVEPGSFWITYCVYDQQNRSSNVISRCIAVKAPGSNNTLFSSTTWTAVSMKEAYVLQGFEEETFVGETYTAEVVVGIYCNNIPSNVTAEIQNRIDYINLSLKADGTMHHEEKFYLKNVDTELSNCTPAYKEITDTQVLEGSWFYDEGSNDLYFVEDTSEDGSIATKFQVTFAGNQMVLREVFTNGDYFETVFQPLN